MIYIDPPFNSNRSYEVFWGEAKEKRAFDDRHASTQAYIEYMRPRCTELARVLKKTGSFYYHCDWHASHYVKVMLDEILGENAFQSEIIWKRATAKSLAFKGFPNNHDAILYYTGGPDFTWNRPFIGYDTDDLDAKTLRKYCHVDPDGRRYTLGDLTNPNPDRPNLKYDFMGHTKVWRWTKERMQDAYNQGIVIQPSAGAVPRVKRYLDEQEGRSVDTVWIDIAPINSQADERIGYPTQKPLVLLERIVSASSNPGDLILDAFCGCGTALVAAEKLDRRWIGIDISPTACRVVGDRLEVVCKLKNGPDFAILGLPRKEAELRDMPPFEFESWAVIALGGNPNRAKVGDMGMDGKIFPVSSTPVTGKQPGELGFMDAWYPVQVKQKDKAGRPDIDAFEAVMMRENRDKGYFVSFGFTSDALTEIGAFFKRTGKSIVPLTVRDILDEMIAMKLT
ncbi:MAG: DNA methyltransferase [Planctomycetota bacterium]|nr:DNA methyltransferase [Planctomycetota bacterium]